MVWVALPPAAIVPQFMVVMFWVQALSWYTPMFGVVVIEPDEPTFELTVMTAKVVAVRDSAPIMSAIKRIFDVFAV